MLFYIYDAWKFSEGTLNSTTIHQCRFIEVIYIYEARKLSEGILNNTEIHGYVVVVVYVIHVTRFTYNLQVSKT